MDDDSFLADSDSLDDVLLHVRRGEMVFIELEHVSDAGVAAGLVSGFCAGADEEGLSLPVVWAGLRDGLESVEGDRGVACVERGFGGELGEDGVSGEVFKQEVVDFYGFGVLLCIEGVGCLFVLVTLLRGKAGDQVVGGFDLRRRVGGVD